jgi:ribosome-binding ATPase
MEIGIIGLPNSGKTTIFNALTRGNRPTTKETSSKLELFSAMVDVPDNRIDRLSAMFTPQKTTYAKVACTDIAGLDQGTGKVGLSGPLRNQISKMDVFLHVIRAFDDPQVPHLLGSINPQRDLEIMDGELLASDLVLVENRLTKIEESYKKAKGDELSRLQKEHLLFERFKEALEASTLLRDLPITTEDRENLRGFELLTLKPALIIVNTGDEIKDPSEWLQYEHPLTVVLPLQGRLQMEIAQLDDADAKIFMEEFHIQELGMSSILRQAYQLLGLQSFFTVGEDEVRAWNVHTGASAVEAARAIHSDLARGFIRAEVVAYDDLIQAGNMAAARKVGKVRLEGKEYTVKDGDILNIRFSI